MLKKYLFASLRGGDFQIEGSSPEDAWSRLCEREKENGSLWKAMDKHRNKLAVENEGFSWLGDVAYKEEQ